MAMRQEGSGLAWLFPFVNGQPPVGWHDAIAYLVLPVLLIASQYASQKLVTPQSDDPAQKQTQAILGFLPFMIGWFSLNVPSGLTLYWFVNNIISTAMQLYMRNTIKVEVPALESAGAGPIIDVSSTVIKPKEDRSKQVSGKELGARKKKGDAAAPAAAAPAANQQPQSSRGQKFRARKSREAAAKAASQAGGQQNGATERQAAPAAAPTATSQQEPLKVPDAPPSKN
jgi:YidC/Oxa1 family membrane protein insertase